MPHMNDQEAIAHYIPQMEGWSSVAKCQTLCRLIKETKAKISVEIGTFAGRGLISMAFAHRTLEHGGLAGTIVHGIDPLRADPCKEGTNDAANNEYYGCMDWDNIYSQLQAAIMAHGLQKWIKFHREKSDKVALIFEPESIGVLHQDGNHSEEVSCAELDLWTPLIAPGGYWVMDDTDWPTLQRARAYIQNKGFTLVEETTETNKWAVFRKQT